LVDEQHLNGHDVEAAVDIKQHDAIVELVAASASASPRFNRSAVPW